MPKHCLGIVFTAQKFDLGTLGASYTPDSTSLHPTSGICDKKVENLGTMNGLVITASTSRTPLVNQVIFEVTITHELGEYTLTKSNAFASNWAIFEKLL